MIYGTPVIHVEDDQTDRIGIRTLVLSQLWQASRWPLSMVELDAETPDVPEVSGGLYFIGRQTRREHGMLRTTWTFEGINGDGKSVTFKDRSNSLDYEFDGAFAEASLLKHPKWRQLRDQYGLSNLDGQISWQDTVPEKAGGPGLAGKGQAGQANPLFGHETYFRLEGTYSFRYAATGIGGINVGVGEIASDIPGAPPHVPGRNWLKAPCKFQRRGPVFDITEIYWLSGDGGWPKEIYGKGNLESSGAGGLDDVTQQFNDYFGTPPLPGYFGPPAPPTK